MGSNMDNLDRSQVLQHVHQLLDRCHLLGGISELKDGILRQYLTREHQHCNERVASWMTELGMKTWHDEVGNQWGRWESSDLEAPSLILGSHLDTVPYAGHYDGILGVLMGVQIVALLKENGIKLPFHLDIVGFCDEEGTRFGATLIGSQALAGQFDPSWLTMQDKQGVSMEQALCDFGLDPHQVHDAGLQADKVLGYWEVHIEQGPVLEAHDISVGVVTAIAGARRANITLRGQAGHSGTTPMGLRKDPLCGAAEFIQTVEQSAKQYQDDRVATVGKISASPGAVNVIPGQVQLSLDVRSQQDEHREALVLQIENHLNRIALARQLSFEMHWTYGVPAVQCFRPFQQLFSSACQQQGLPVYSLPSGAGHDAMAMASLCDVGMLFIRSPEGISHHPREAVYKADVADAMQVLWSSLLLMAEKYKLQHDEFHSYKVPESVGFDAARELHPCVRVVTP